MQTLIVFVIVYLTLGMISEFMRGYSHPEVQANTTALQDWISFLLWPIFAPSTVGNFGANIRRS